MTAGGVVAVARYRPLGRRRQLRTIRRFLSLCGHPGLMIDDERYENWRDDARVLAEVGRHLSTQQTRLQVRLPRALAAAARSAWERDVDERPLPPETAEQQQVRRCAGVLGLIGLAIETGGIDAGDDVVVEIDAWEIGLALEAADEAGLLGS